MLIPQMVAHSFGSLAKHIISCLSLWLLLWWSKNLVWNIFPFLQCEHVLCHFLKTSLCISCTFLDTPGYFNVFLHYITYSYYFTHWDYWFLYFTFAASRLNSCNSCNNFIVISLIFSSKQLCHLEIMIIFILSHLFFYLSFLPLLLVPPE